MYELMRKWLRDVSVTIKRKKRERLLIAEMTANFKPRYMYPRESVPLLP